MDSIPDSRDTCYYVPTIANSKVRARSQVGYVPIKPILKQSQPRRFSVKSEAPVPKLLRKVSFEDKDTIIHVRSFKNLNTKLTHKIVQTRCACNIF